MKKKAQKEAKGATTPEQTQARERTSITVAAHQLRPAPWNPRPEITSESVADITASLPKVGLIHPLVVMRDPDKPSVRGVDFYVIISGHRRFRACLDAGYRPIPCDLVDVDVATAKQMTIIENLQRRDADPLLESELVKSLMDDGMTQAEIAAETGRGERWVARRANLMKLSDGWRERVRKGEKITTDCLEHIAAYPEEIQEKLKDANSYYRGEGEPLSWYQISSQFRSQSRDLKGAAFDTAECLSCSNNTGCCPDLFDMDGGKDAKLGRCLCDTCWRDKHEAHVAETVAKAEKKGAEIVRKKPDSPWAATDRKTKEYTTLYVYKDGDQRVAKWFKPPEKKAKPDAKEAAESKEARRRERLLEVARDEAAEKFTDWTDEHAKDGDWPKWFVDAAVADMVREISDYGAGDLEAAVDAFVANTGFTASDAEADKLYKEYLAQFAEAKAAEAKAAEAKAAEAKAADTTDSEVPDEAEL